MEAVRTYLLTVIAAAFICTFVVEITGKKSSHATIIRLLSGLFLVITVLSPWIKVNFQNIYNGISDYNFEATSIVLDGENIAVEAMKEIIKENTEAYILDKANAMGVAIAVSVSVSDDPLPVPNQVEIQGSAGPYAKKQIQEHIENDLGIPKENQLWI